MSDVKKFLMAMEDALFVTVLGILCAMFYSIHVSGTVAVWDYHFLRIISNSMDPTLTPNTCIIVKKVPEEELQVGDIITFVSHDSSIYGKFNTHRIYSIIHDNETGKKRYVTKGDFFEIPDGTSVTYEDIMGRFVTKVPFSRVISFLVVRLANSRIYFLVIIIPLVLCFLSYLYDLMQMLIFGVETEEQMLERKRQQKLMKKQMRERRRERRRQPHSEIAENEIGDRNIKESEAGSHKE